MNHPVAATPYHLCSQFCNSGFVGVEGRNSLLGPTRPSCGMHCTRSKRAGFDILHVRGVMRYLVTHDLSWRTDTSSRVRESRSVCWNCAFLRGEFQKFKYEYAGNRAFLKQELWARRRKVPVNVCVPVRGNACVHMEGDSGGGSRTSIAPVGIFVTFDHIRHTHQRA